MANSIFPKFKEHLLSSVLSVPDVKAVLVDGAEYTYSATHEFLSDIPSAAREEISAALASKTFTNGVFDANDTSFPAASGDPSECVVLFIDTGNPATSRLIAYFDTGSGLPVILNGGTVNITWSNDANRILAL